jgi:uncharacterized RDD family membrane protein YckC
MAQETVFCSTCGYNNLAGGAFCQKCGASLVGGIVTGAAPAPVAPVIVAANPYGGFWIRLLAYILDRIIIGILLSPIYIMLAVRMAADLHRMAPNDPFPFVPVFHFVAIIACVGFIVQWLYEALLTSSSWQATFGKRIVNLKVTDEAGNRISFERATARFFAKILSGLILWIGFIMIAFTARKQGLHDILAGTLVMKTDIVIAPTAQPPNTGNPAVQS